MARNLPHISNDAVLSLQTAYGEISGALTGATVTGSPPFLGGALPDYSVSTRLNNGKFISLTFEYDTYKQPALRT